MALSRRSPSTILIGFARGDVRGQVGQDHDRKFQALGAMHRHQAHAVGIFFEHRRFGRFFFLGLRGQLLDESAKGDPARHFIGAREIGHARDVRQNLIAARAQDESRVRARRFEQRVHGGRERLAIARAMQFAEQRQRFLDRREVRVRIRSGL